MDATNVVTSTDTVGIGYNHQGHPAHLRSITTTGDDHHTPQHPTSQCDDRRSWSRSNGRIHQRDRSTSRSRHPSTDRHTSRDRNTGWRHMPDRHRTQSRSPHRQRPSNNRPLTLYTRHNSRSRSSSCNNDKQHRRSVTIQDNPADNVNQDYDNIDDYFDEDLN